MEDLHKKTCLFALIGAALYALLFCLVDRPVALWIHRNLAGTWLETAGTYVSYLANGSLVRLGPALCFILIVLLDPGLKKKGTRGLLLVCLSAAVAITIGDGLKYLLGRCRPVLLFEEGRYGLTLFANRWELNSTPSGHTIRAFAILTSLSLLDRPWRPFFIALAVLIGLSRVLVTAHYPSDVLFGSYIGIFSALWTYRYFPSVRINRAEAEPENPA